MIKKLGIITVLMAVLSIVLAPQEVSKLAREPATINFSRSSIQLQVGQISTVEAFVYDEAGLQITNLAVGWLPGTISTCVTLIQGIVTATRAGSARAARSSSAPAGACFFRSYRPNWRGHTGLGTPVCPIWIELLVSRGALTVRESPDPSAAKY